MNGREMRRQLDDHAAAILELDDQQVVGRNLLPHGGRARRR